MCIFYYYVFFKSNLVHILDIILWHYGIYIQFSHYLLEDNTQMFIDINYAQRIFSVVAGWLFILFIFWLGYFYKTLFIKIITVN